MQGRVRVPLNLPVFPICRPVFLQCIHLFWTGPYLHTSQYPYSLGRCSTAAVNLLSEKYLKQQHKYLIRAKRYIEENYADPNLSLNLLAEQCKTTTSYLSRLFKESFGINFVDYLNQYRIEKAKELLMTTSKPVKEIASTSGFNSQQNFIRVFKKHAGMTPGQYKSEQDTLK